MASGPASYDPYDGLSGAPPWSWLRRQPLLARLWTQGIKRNPINLRPFVRIRPLVHAKSLTDLALAALLRHRLGTDPQALPEARRFLEDLRARVISGYSGACWGMPFHYITRFVRAEAGDPNLFQSICAADAFLTAYEMLGDSTNLELARSTVDFIREDLGVVDEGGRGVWFRYFVGNEVAVYNVAALTGALLLRLACHTGEEKLATLGRRAIEFVLQGQNRDGSWFYARGEQGRWVDGFHTGYILEALLQASFLDRDRSVEAALQRGDRYYRQRMFTPEGLPRYTSRRLYPIEVQNCAQAIQTLARLCWRDPQGLSFLHAVTRSVTAALFRFVREGPEPRGYFILSRGRWLRNRLPAIRWGQAPMLVAFESLFVAEKGLSPSWGGLRRNAGADE